ncbi:MaoC family dehydratase [Micromonospora echinospora]|uniref:MaoC family dehydratase n=1 Tax=Micromonospora echinospora TaxID=1877 RepID=UPI003A837D53
MSRYANIKDLLSHEGEQLGTTDWQLVDQARVDAFADVTGDHQWIHVDRERAVAESPFKGTIAHGALTLSISAALLADLVEVDSVRLVVNAGLEKVRFRSAVPVGSRIRGTATLVSTRAMGEGARVVVRVQIDVEGVAKPACVADWVLVLHE